MFDQWKQFSVAALCVAVAAVAGCGRRQAAITVAGSTAFQPFAEKLAEELMAKRPDLAITVQGGGSAVGIQSALSGAAQIGMADLVELPPEAQSLTSVVVARDGVSMVVHPSNPLSNLTTDQIRGIFNGALRNWKELGGKDAPITVVSREAGSGTRTSFEQIITGINLTRDAVVQDSNGTIRETVANDPNAVGYLTHGVVNSKVKAVTVDGKDCTTEAIMAGEYKLVRPVFFLIKGVAEGTAKEFIDYVLSAEGQEIIKKNGLIPAK
ncbi:MAG: phosphate ABC transporter substrate-binding protein [Verrucomicrobia bacterium]|nr:phosphate ABC transporter substrate-binding protein [Verrucomicrobiota bacterium]